jgi:YidC/Oxa1 family membrane protein insertase
VSTTQHLAGALPVLGSALGRVFQPLYQAMAWLLAACYALIPNYAVAITLLTLVVMAVSAPLTIKSSRSMLAMQRLQPELKKLQEKYKDNRVRLNDATLGLYREHGVHPVSGCLPALLQVPVFVVLFGVIRGLTHTVDHGRVAAPLYVSHSAQLAKSIRAHPGQMNSFGINLVASLFSAHASWLAYLPYVALVLVAIGMQYFQTWQINRRATTGASTPQFLALQRYIPFVFAVIYVRFPGGLNIYFVVSAACRIVIQEVALRPKALSRRRAPMNPTLPQSDDAPVATKPVNP